MSATVSATSALIFEFTRVVVYGAVAQNGPTVLEQTKGVLAQNARGPVARGGTLRAADPRPCPCRRAARTWAAQTSALTRPQPDSNEQLAHLSTCAGRDQAETASSWNIGSSGTNRFSTIPGSTQVA